MGAPGGLRGGCGGGRCAAVRDARHALADDHTGGELDEWTDELRVGERDGRFEPAGLDAQREFFGERIGVRVGVTIYTGRPNDHAQVWYDNQDVDAQVDPEVKPVVESAFNIIFSIGEPVGVTVGICDWRSRLTRVPESSLV